MLEPNTSGRGPLARAARSWLWAIACVALGGLSTACDDDGGAAATSDAGAGGGDGCGEAPFCGDLPSAPEGTADITDRDSFPLLVGSVWRYRLREDNWQMPPPITEGGVAELKAGAAEGEVVRETSHVLDVPVPGDNDGAMVKVVQVIRETLRSTPGQGDRGPKIQVVSLNLTEHAVDDGRLIREVDRSWQPPYTLIEDVFRVGLIATRSSASPQMIQVTTLGGAEPNEQRGVVEVLIDTTDTPGVEPMEGRYREGVHRIDVVDDFSRALTRSYWVEPKVGIIRWRFRESENRDLTLVDTNLEAPAAEADAGVPAN